MESSPQTSLHRTLVIMAKAPKPGAVKTRLAQRLPLPAVTQLYCCLLQDTVMLAQSLPGVRVAFMCPGTDVDDLARFLGNPAQIVGQKDEGLAAGLTSVFAHFAAADQHHVIAFNSDTPHLPAAILETAFHTLVAHDVVIGPTHDGGYYLVGAKASHPTLFENDGMGTTSALEALQARARLLELSTAFTDPFYDIDVAEDLIQLAVELQLAPDRAPRTAAWLAEWGETVARLRPPMEEL